MTPTRVPFGFDHIIPLKSSTQLEYKDEPSQLRFQKFLSSLSLNFSQTSLHLSLLMSHSGATSTTSTPPGEEGIQVEKAQRDFENLSRELSRVSAE